MSEKPVVYVLNGPNLNLLGVRQPEIYGRDTLADIAARCEQRAAGYGLEISFHQSNHEGEIVETIHKARENGSAIIINPAAYTHTSVAILDALMTFEGPVVELHLSNPHRREKFRNHSYVSLAATGVICGFGAYGYELAVEAAANAIGARKVETA